MLKRIIKVVAAVVVGLALLDLFCYWYYNPADYIQDESWATDVVREPGAFTSRANEGFCWTTIDENGYVNREVPGEDGVFVLMMGSSHVEGLYVRPGDDVSSQLGERLSANGVDGFVYNIGMSGHDLTLNVRNLDRALTRFEPSYVAIETRTVMHFAHQVYGVLNGDQGRNGPTEAVISEWISERPLLRTVYRQLANLRTNEALSDDSAASGEGAYEYTQEVYDLYEEAMLELMRMVRDTADAHGAAPIIYYHPALRLLEDGAAAPETDPRCMDIYREACERAGVRFLDLTDAFLEAYASEHILPHGFINTRPEEGHLNADGNRIIAEALCAEILKREAIR